jgi:hypothetical protein
MAAPDTYVTFCFTELVVNSGSGEWLIKYRRVMVGMPVCPLVKMGVWNNANRHVPQITLLILS